MNIFTFVVLIESCLRDLYFLMFLLCDSNISIIPFSCDNKCFTFSPTYPDLSKVVSFFCSYFSQLLSVLFHVLLFSLFLSCAILSELLSLYRMVLLFEFHVCFCFMNKLVLPGMRFISRHYMSKHVERVMWPLIFQLVNKEASPGVLERWKTVALKKPCSNTIYIFVGSGHCVWWGFLPLVQTVLWLQRNVIYIWSLCP